MNRGLTSKTSTLVMAVLTTAGACIASIASPAPAHADPDDGVWPSGCLVTPRTPTVIGYYQGNQPVARYQADITCKANRIIKLSTSAYEQDDGHPGDVGGDDLIKTINFAPITIGNSSESHVLRFDWTVPDWDAPDHRVELFHRVSYQVIADGTASPWHKFKSPVLSTWALGTPSP